MAKRISLRQFQQNLSQRLSVAMAGESQRAWLGFRPGHEYWLDGMANAGELVPLQPLTPVPLAKPWFRGIANIRGTLYNVLDFAAFQGGEATPTNSESRLLLPNARVAVGVALLVNKALGLRGIDTLEQQPDSNDPRAWVDGEYNDNEGHVWKTLVFEALLSNPEFLDVAL